MNKVSKELIRKIARFSKNRIKIVEVIELGLNMLAQDLVFKKHTEKDINNYINKFKFQEVK